MDSSYSLIWSLKVTLWLTDLLLFLFLSLLSGFQFETRLTNFFLMFNWAFIPSAILCISDVTVFSL